MVAYEPTSNPRGSSSAAALAEHVRINHRRGHVIVPEQLLNRADVRAPTKKIHPAPGEASTRRRMESGKRPGEADCALGVTGLSRAQAVRTNALRSPVSSRVKDTARRSLGQGAPFIRT